MITTAIIATTTLIKAAQFIVALALLVFIHELGHYFFARVFGIKVNRFYLFFNPYFSLLKYFPSKGRIELISWGKSTNGEDTGEADGKKKCLLAFNLKKRFSPVNKKGHPSWAATLYGIGWLPLGGYCDIDGMIDETTSADQLSADPKPWEFRTKAAWKRLLVMMGGVMFNFILAIVLYTAIAFTWGEKYIPLEKAVYGYDYVPTAIEAGFRNGDVPIMADGKKLDAADADMLYSIADAKVVTVLRDGKDTVNITLPEGFMMKLNDEKGFMSLRIPVYVATLVNGEAAQKAGIMEGDHIVAIDTVATPTFTELTPTLEAYADKATTVTVERDGKTITLPVTPNSAGKLGFQLKRPEEVLETVTVNYSLPESVTHGISTGTTTLTTYVSSLKYLFTKEGAQSIGGFGAMGSMFPATWNWESFWFLTAFLSVVLAFMNFLPIPALDGGHILFLLIEMISRRKLPEKFLGYAQTVGFFFLLLLLVYANGMDIFRAFFK